MPSHLAAHHPRDRRPCHELDRIAGYEANYAGTSFVKIADVGKLKYGSKLFNVTADRTFPTGMATVGFDDDGVKAQKWPLVKTAFSSGFRRIEKPRTDGREREPRLHLREHWRNYPFLRMPNVQLEAVRRDRPRWTR
jgi:TldD protein